LELQYPQVMHYEMKKMRHFRYKTEWVKKSVINFIQEPKTVRWSLALCNIIYVWTYFYLI